MSCDCKSEACSQTPRKLKFGFIDYVKALFSWFNSFHTTFIIEPGLYYIGDTYDVNTPMLVTCNYHMTVFLLYRILKKRNVRILVIDTKGINVWCSSGKGQFSAKEIFRQLDKYPPEMLNSGGKLEIILPKLSLSGVSLAALKERLIVPKIGPIYAHDIPAYLDDLPLKNRIKDKFKFTLKDRVFTLIPSVAQFLVNSVPIAAALFIINFFFKIQFHWHVIAISTLFAILYILLFPLLPTKTFSIKAIVLSLLFSAGYTAYFMFTGKALLSLTYFLYITTTFAYGIFFALYYTGSTGVSNYSLVKKEMIRYLPVTFLFFVASLVLVIVKGVIA